MTTLPFLLQGAWAYRYWQVEENARRQVKNVVELISEAIMEEFEKLTEKLAFLKQSKVTVYDPELGEIQVDVVLPLHFKSLREMPDLQFYETYLQQANDAIDQYVPAKSTVLHYYSQVSTICVACPASPIFFLHNYIQVKDRLCRIPESTELHYYTHVKYRLRRLPESVRHPPQ